MKKIDIFELLEIGFLVREETQTNEGNWQETKHVYSISPGCEVFFENEPVEYIEVARGRVFVVTAKHGVLMEIAHVNARIFEIL